MKRLRMIISLLVISTVISVNSIQANASTTGWQGDNTSGWWYVDNTGNYVTGWKYIDGNWYYMNEQGWMLSNTTINGYNLGADGAWITKSGPKNTGVSSVSGGDGSLAASNRNNTQQSSSDSHADYFKNKGGAGGTAGSDTSAGQRIAQMNGMGDTTTTSTSTSQKSTSGGWEQVNGAWYYYDANGQKKTGWIEDGGNWFYLQSNGVMAKNTTINGYYLGSNGAWTTGRSDYFNNADASGGAGGGDGSLAASNR